MDVLTKTVGNCLTERKVYDFDERCQKYKTFLSVDQWVSQPMSLRDEKGIQVVEPKLVAGTILYGIEKDGTLSWLGEIIDSSD